MVSRGDTDTTIVASTEPSVCTDGGFPGGPSGSSILTGFAHHVAYRIWQGEVCNIGLVLCLIFIFITRFDVY